MKYTIKRKGEKISFSKVELDELKAQNFDGSIALCEYVSRKWQIELTIAEGDELLNKISQL